MRPGNLTLHAARAGAATAVIAVAGLLAGCNGDGPDGASGQDVARAPAAEGGEAGEEATAEVGMAEWAGGGTCPDAQAIADATGFSVEAITPGAEIEDGVSCAYGPSGATFAEINAGLAQGEFVFLSAYDSQSANGMPAEDALLEVRSAAEADTGGTVEDAPSLGEGAFTSTLAGGEGYPEVCAAFGTEGGRIAIAMVGSMDVGSAAELCPIALRVAGR